MYVHTDACTHTYLVTAFSGLHIYAHAHAHMHNVYTHTHTHMQWSRACMYTYTPVIADTHTHS